MASAASDDDAYMDDSSSAGSLESAVDSEFTYDGSDDDEQPVSHEPRTLSPKELEALFLERVGDCGDKTGLSVGDAMLLLQSLEWNGEKVTHWYDSDARQASMRRAAGLVSDAPGAALAATAAAGTEEVECPACLDDFPASEMVAGDCNHRCCKACWRNHFLTGDVTINTKAVTRLPCLTAGCHRVVNLDLVRAVLSAEQASKYLHWMIKSFVESRFTRDIKWCPTSGCEAYIVNPRHESELEGVLPVVQCTACSKRWCFTCQEEPHQPATCKQVENWRAKSNDSDLTKMWLKANTKKCPKCHKPAQKALGCQHVKCSQCFHHFCWLCLRPYSEHNESTGGFYACHKFEARLKNEGKTAEEKARALAARNLRNYNMAVERHLSHKQQREEADTELRNVIKDHSQQLSEIGNYTVGTFLEDALNLTIKCRSCLAWSYVYKFYKFDSEDVDRELAMFEDYQGHLEQFTRQLQDTITAPVTPYLALTMDDDASTLKSRKKSKHKSIKKKAKKQRTRAPSASGGGAGGGAGAGAGAGGGYDMADVSASFDAFRTDVQRRISAVTKFLDTLYKFDQEGMKMFEGVAWEKKDTSVDLTKVRPVWEWQDGHGVWNPYSDETIAELEQSFNSGKTLIPIESGGRKYQLDLVGLRQTNLETRGSRVIRRRMAKGADWSCGRCSYHNSHRNSVCQMCQTRRGATR